jgi:hypothetical protein
VTPDAFHVAVFPEKRILGLLVVIERNHFPASLHVAGFTFDAEAALVFVILLVARKTV